MAIKILVPPKFDAHSFVITCSYCECKFEYEQEDTSDIQTGMNEWETIIKCPGCNSSHADALDKGRRKLKT